MAFITGTSGNDNISGTATDDDLRGQGGNDVLVGGDGNDYMEGNTGNDSLFGGNGDDNMRGNEGDDMLAGAAGNDFMAGSLGNDAIFGEAGNDDLRGEDGNDALLGGGGDDLLVGGTGDDYMVGELGNDRLFGEQGNDNMRGGEGSDLLAGGAGNDYLSADLGNDTLLGDEGQDRLDGGAGNNLLDGGQGNDVLNGGAGNDTMIGDSGANTSTAGQGIFRWSAVADPDDGGQIDAGDNLAGRTVTQNVNGTFVSVTMPVLQSDFSTADIVTTGLPSGANDFSSLRSVAENAQAGTYDITFSQAVTNLSFSLSDLGTGLDYVDIVAYNAAGGRIPLDIIEGSDLQVNQSNGIDLRISERIQQVDGSNDPTAAAIVNIAGPVAKITIAHVSVGGQLSWTYLSDLSFTTTTTPDGNDYMDGGQGADIMLGGAGADTIAGAAGSDTIDGGDGADLIMGGNAAGTQPTPLTLWANDGNANLYRIDVDAAGIGTRVLVGNSGTVMLDIAMGADGRLFGVADNALFSINTTNGAATFVGNMGNGANGSALSFGADGLLYNSNGATILRFNPDTPSNTTVFWANPDGGRPAGDFLTVGDKIYVSWLTPSGATQLLQLNLNSAGAVASSSVLGNLPNETFGLALGPDGSIYATSGNTIFKLTVPNAPISGLIPSTAVSGSTIGGVYFGATSNTETSLINGLDLGDSISGGAGNDTIFGMDGNDSIFGGDGADQLQGDAGNDQILYGRGLDTVFGGDGDDFIDDAPGIDSTSDRTLAYGGAGQDTIFGASSQDTLYGGSGADSINGESGDDAVFGEFGNDSLQGGAGNDLLDGGQGADLIYGGDGNDRLDGGTNDGESDTLYGNTGDDLLFGGTGGADTLYGGDGSDSLGGGLDTDVLYGDAGDDVLFGDQSGGTSLEGADTLFGGDGNDQIFLNSNANLRGGLAVGGNGNDNIGGTGLADLIYGDAGNDGLFSGAGTDTVYGGSGDDYVADTGGGNATTGADLVYGGDGNDNMRGSQSADTIYGDLGDDYLNGGDSGDQLFGGDGNELIEAGRGDDLAYGGAGNDYIIDAAYGQLDGGLGNDRFFGGEGNDTLIGGIGGDLLDSGTGQDLVRGESGNDTILNGLGGDLVYGGDGDDLIDDAAGANSSADADTIYGDSGNDSLFGSSAGDLLYGGADNDQLTGEAGNDTLYGGDGGDTLTGGTGNDVIMNGAGSDLIYGGDGDDLLDDVTGILATLNTDIIYGGAGNDTAFGSGASDRLFGDEGNDVLVAELGDDTLDGGDGDDALFGGDGIDNLEGGRGNDIVDAGAGDDWVYGGAGDDRLLSSAGDAKLFGGEGNDTVFGGAGDDNFAGESGNDLFYGDDGADTSYGGMGDDIAYGGAGEDVLLGDEGNDALYGDSGDDLLIDRAGNDSAFGGAGNDLAFGGTGDDLVDGGDGNDTVLGDVGNDQLTGGAGDDLLDGGDGDDLLIAGDGADILRAGAGNDSLSGGAGNDTAEGDDGDDLLLLEAGDDRALGGAGNDFVNGGEGNDTIYGEDGNDSLNGNDGNDQLFGGTGDNVLGGQNGQDFIRSNAGRDTIFGGAGGDTVESGAGDDAVYGDDGDDALLTDAGNDATFGGAGNDALQTGFGDDLADGGAGNDWFNTDWGNDTILGGAGNDTTAANNEGDDLIFGGDGNDFMAGGNGDDSVFGDSGNDGLEAGTGNDAVYGGDGDDIIQGGAGRDTLEGGAGNDDLGGGWGDDLVAGDAGDDTILGFDGFGSDIAVGGELGETSGDVIDLTAMTNATQLTFTGSEAGVITSAWAAMTFSEIEQVNLGSGNDIVTGNGGNNTANAGAGNDSLNGGAGSDSLAGGAGDDLFSHTLAQNAGAVDRYDGQAGIDELHLSVTSAEWANPLFQTDVASLLAHIASASSAPFVFASTGLTVVSIERFTIDIDGVPTDPVNALAIVNADAVAAGEDGSAAAVNLLTNDLVLDRAGSVTLLTPSTFGTVAIVTDLLATPQTAIATFTPGAGAQALNAGEVVTEVLTYRVTDVDGSTSTATLSITLTGANDTASITGLAVGAISEDALQSLSGTLTVTDVDNGQAVFQAPTGLNGTYGTFAFDTATGAWRYTPNASTPALESLAVGAQVNDQITVKSLDGTASQTITVTITGTNDAPTLAAAVASVGEDAPSLTLNLATLGDDIDSDDDGASLQYTITGAPSVGSASISGTTLSYNGGAGLDTLAAGEKVTTVITVTATDGNGGSVSNDVTVTITGTNDAPTLAAAVASVGEDAPSLTLNLATLGDDIDSDDDGASLQYTITGAPSVGSASISGTTLSYNGGAGLDTLAAGENLTTVITVTATDGNGGSVSNDVTVTITGTNDAPTLAAAVASVGEDAPSLTLNLATLGDDIDSDDDGASLQYTITGAPSVGSASISGTTLSYNGGAGLDTLAAGENLTTVITVTATDGNGGSVSNDVTVTITGTNDAPTLAAAVASVGEDAPSLTLNLATLGDDIDSDDDGASLQYTITGAPSVGSASISGTTLSYNGGAGLDTLAAGENLTTVITVTASDGNGGSVSNDVTVTITGTNDAPTVAAALTAAATEGDTALQTIDLLAGAGDVDAGEAATLTIANVSGLVDGITLVGTSLVVDPSAAGFDFVPEGQTRDIIVTYDVVDVQGAAVSQTATITITGTNDAPVTADLSVSANEGDGLVTFDLLAGATDPDEGETATLTVTPYTGLISIPPWASFVGNTLVVDTSDPAYDSLAQGQTIGLSAIYTVRDVNGAAGNFGLNGIGVTITGINDAPTLAAGALAAVEDDASVTLDLASIGDDIDSDDDGSTLTYTITGAPNLGTASITGSTLTYVNAAGLDTLAAGDNLSTVITVTATDAHGASVSNNVTVTITGTNDAPTLAAAQASLGEDAPSLTLNLATLGDDIDSDDDGSTLIYAITSGPAIGTATLTGTQITYVPGTAFNYLAQGERTSQVIGISATDSQGAVVTSSVTVTITGTNDAPVVAVGPTPDPVVTIVDKTMTVTGTVRFTDADFTNSHSGSGIDPFGNALIISEVGSAQNGGVGEWAWTFDIDLNTTAAGTVLPFTWKVVDTSGAELTQTIEFTVPAATNTLPDVSTPITFSSIVGDGVVPFLLSDYYLDEQGDALSALPNPLQQYPGIIFTGGDEFLLNSDDTAYQFLLTGQSQTFTYTYLVSDGTGSAEATLEWTIEGTREGVIGTADDDVLTGGDFVSELLNGGEGSDVMTGGAGDDIFAYLAAEDLFYFDVVTDFVEGEDKIGISAEAFGGNLVAGGAATVTFAANYINVFSNSTDGQFIYENTGTDLILYWDADGGAGFNATAFATLIGPASLSSDDFFIFI